MSQAITLQAILSIISKINSFVEESDQKIAHLWSNYDNSKVRLEEQYKNFVAQAKKQRDESTDATNKKASVLKESAVKIYREVIDLDTTLANADKYYVKTRDNKAAELAQITDTTADNELDIFDALEKVKKQFEDISVKYSKDTLPALIDGVAYFFSKQRKQDYEELVVLKNTIEKLMGEIKKMIPELTNDSVQVFAEKYKEKIASIDEKYRAELSKLDNRYEQNVEALADEICLQLDSILPDSLLVAIRDTNNDYPNNLSNITANYKTWDKAVTLGFIDYPLELYVNSKILFSLIADKCKAILVHSKLLRFPLVCSLQNGLQLLVKHTQDGLREKLICSVMQNFISSVPVSQLSFLVIDCDNKGKSVAPFAEFIRKLPKLFDYEILTSIENVEERLNEFAAYIAECKRYKLGSTYSNIYDYADDNCGEIPQVKVLVIFDPPQTLGEKAIALTSDILNNGAPCGVGAIIAMPLDSRQSGNTLPGYNEKGCIVIKQVVDMFMCYGLRMTYAPTLEGKEMSRYINRYLLSHDSIQSNVAMLNSDACNLLMPRYTDDITEIINSTKRTIENYIDRLGTVSTNNSDFPAEIPIGTFSVPVDLVSDSKILSLLKTELVASDKNSIAMPAVFSLTEKNNLFTTCPDVIRQHIERFVHNLIWSFLSFIPVSKVNFCIFDAERRGNSITPFLDFRQRLPDIFDGQLYTSQDAMISRLQKLNGYIDDFIQMKLGNRFGNIVEYNEKNPTRSEAVTLLAIFDFPRNFDSRSIELLQNILSNGSKCGIFSIICHNPDVTFSRYESIDEQLPSIREHCTSIEYIDSKYVLLPYELAISVAPELLKSKVDTFAIQYLEANEALKRKGLLFEDAVRPPFFTASTAKRLSIPVGIGDGEEVAHLVLGEGSSHHGIVAGATGSGKSTLLHTIIMSAMLCHSPDEIHLYLMDFKSGTEFKIYESVNLPHIQLLALDAMQEFGESILENLVDEMLRRGELFKSSGQSSLAGFVNSTGKALPRILVIMDEFQVLFNDSANRKVAMNCAELTKRIVTEGRAFGIHLLMATQSTKVISDLTLSHAIIEQMRVRIGLKCGEDDTRYLFSDRNDSNALEMMKGPIGTAVMNLEYMESSNIGFRAAYCSKESQEQYLSIIAEKFADVSTNTQVFEGNRTVMLVDYLLQNKIVVSTESVVNVYMGTLIKVAPPFVMQFDRRRRHNLLICGANERMAENLTNICMFSALLNTNTDVLCIDGENLIGESVSASLYDCMENISPRFKSAKSKGEIVALFKDLHSTFLQRKKTGELKQNFVVIKNMQYLDIIKKMFRGESVDEGEFSENCSSDFSNESAFNFGASEDYSAQITITEKLLQLIDEGSSYGIFFVVSSLEYQSVKENMYYGENILAKFPERIVFALSNNDADNLIDGVAVSGLRDNTVCFTDGVKATFQLKPYVMPEVDSLKEFFEKLPLGSDVR